MGFGLSANLAGMLVQHLQPVADNTTAAGRAKNRRVTVEVVGTRKVAR